MYSAPTLTKAASVSHISKLCAYHTEGQLDLLYVQDFCPSNLMPETVNGDRKWVYETASNIAFSDPETLCPGPSARLPVILDPAAHSKMAALVAGSGDYWITVQNKDRIFLHST